jgi:PAS domain S-box-containing protein
VARAPTAAIDRAAPSATDGVALQLDSGTATFAFDANSQIVSWNAAAEKLLGVPATEAIGRPCWEVLRGSGTCGSVECHPGCATGRLARDGFPVPPRALVIRKHDGDRCLVTVDTVGARIWGVPLVLHVLREAVTADDALPSEPRLPWCVRLTPRQGEILKLIAQGLSARAIANELRLREATVRNHIHAVLVELSAHSQLEAVANARSAGLL